MYEFWYQVECDGVDMGGEFFGSAAQECADYVREQYQGYKKVNLISILRVETDWE